jgi:hypothetical protein
VSGATREQAESAVAAAAAQRDTIQANLLELDASFGKRLLAGAHLDGETRQRWDAAAATLTRLWETFSAYSAVVDQAAELLRGRKSGAALADLAALLTSASVPVPTTSALASRDLTRTGTAAVTLAAAVGEMRREFAGVAELVTTVERVWNERPGSRPAASPTPVLTRRPPRPRPAWVDAPYQPTVAAGSDQPTVLPGHTRVMRRRPITIWGPGWTSRVGWPSCAPSRRRGSPRWPMPCPWPAAPGRTR